MNLNTEISSPKKGLVMNQHEEGHSDASQALVKQASNMHDRLKGNDASPTLEKWGVVRNRLGHMIPKLVH